MPVDDHRSRRLRLRRRIVSVPAVFACALLLTVTLPLWVPLSMLADAVRLRWRFPVARLLAFALCWSWTECAGVARASWEWITGHSADHDRHYALMTWWTGTLMRGLGATTGLRVEVRGQEELAGGDAIVLSRHASLGDSLVSAWMFCCVAGLRPRYVLKRELLGDPCLDIVGLRVPNHFLDREAVDGDAELDEITKLAHGLDASSVAVIFPEGTRASATKRRRALEKIAERDPARAARMSELRHLLPPRPAGSGALVAGAPDADIVLVWHTGFDGLDTFGGILRRVARKPTPAVLVARRVPRHEVPVGTEFERWLDDRWLEMDAEVAAELSGGS